MDPNVFTENRLGRLIPVKIPHEDWTFIPALLPHDWELPAKLGELLGDAREALGILEGLGRNLENPNLLMRPLQNREALTSSSLEGTYVTPQQLLLYEIDPLEAEPGDEQRLDWQEVHNYSRALQRGCAMIDEDGLPFLLRVIKEMHRVLLLGPRAQRARAGEFRQQQVQIGSHGRYIPPPHLEVPDLMANLEKYINTPDQRLNPLVQCFIVHYQFEAIHPFVDGNGRVGRALLALMIYKLMGLTKPWLYLSAYYEKFKTEYIDNLFRISTHGDWNSWIEFCLRGTVWQAKDAIRRCDRFQEIKAEHRDQVVNPSPRTYLILEGLFHDPIVTAPLLAERLTVSYPTAKNDIDRLVESGILQEIAETRPRAYFAPKIMKAAYGEPEELASE
jgi:Fic family protein